MEPYTLLNILAAAARLKTTPRHCMTEENRAESVADHSWRTALFAMLLDGVPEYADLDLNRVIRMCLIHDLGECFTGDIPTFLKTAKDNEVEESLLGRWIGSLPEGPAGEMQALLAEMEAQQTPEARIYKALDKLEAVIQHNESPIDTWADNEYELNKTYAFDTVAFSDWLTRLRKEILKDTLVKIEEERGKSGNAN